MILRFVVHGLEWLVLTYEFDTARQARLAWEAVDKVDAGPTGLGVVRLAPNLARSRPGEPGPMRTGATMGKHAVVAVASDASVAEACLAVLAATKGKCFTPTDDFAESMILRRIKVIASAGPNDRGRMRVRRPDARGAALDRSGDLHEPKPPKG
jgi:hypothetical protein